MEFIFIIPRKGLHITGFCDNFGYFILGSENLVALCNLQN